MTLIIPIEKVTNCNLERLLKGIKIALYREVNNSKRLMMWDEYLDQLPQYKNNFNKHIKSRNILFAGIDNLMCYKTPKCIKITMNRNVKLPYLGAKLYEVCNLIEHGNMEIEGWHLFNKIFNQVKKEFDEDEQKTLR